MIKVNKTDSTEAKKKAKEKAEGILKRVKTGEDFAKLAVEFSEDPGSKNKGGDLGFFPKGRMIKPFDEAAFNPVFRIKK
jgi:parvulin-like peptidyl-prolyl isomerase